MTRLVYPEFAFQEKLYRRCFCISSSAFETATAQEKQIVEDAAKIK